MTALRNTLVGGLTVLALLVALPAPVRAGWVECESTAPGELHVGVLLNPNQAEIDPAIESVVWRTVGPTEKVFYEGPKINFGMTITGLEPGLYSIVYDYSGPNGTEQGRFCSLRVYGEPTPVPAPASTPAPAPTRSPSPVRTPAPTARPAVATAAPADAPVTQAPSPTAPASALDLTAPPPSADPSAAVIATTGGTPLVGVGIALLALAALIALAALRPRRH